MKKAILAFIVIALFIGCTTVQNRDSKKEIKMEKVSFESKGVKLIGNIYYPADFVVGKKYPAIISTGAWTTVKEQMPMIYAKKLAEEGFITFIFDFRGWGESGGDNKYLEDPIRKTEDITAAADFLRTLDAVDSAKVGGLGICASSGYMTKAYVEGKIDALSLVAPWLHNEQIVESVYGGKESVSNLLAVSDDAALKFESTGEVQAISGASTTDDTVLMFNVPYYTEPERGLIPEYDNMWNLASWRPWLSFDAIQYAELIEEPVLFVESDLMALPQGSASFKEIAGNNVKSVNLSGVFQFDFYDQEQPVNRAVKAVTEFMKEYL